MGELVQDFYRRLRKAPRSAHCQMWTKDRCIVALHYWLRDEGCMPTFTALNKAEGLPSWSSLHRFFSTLNDWRIAYTRCDKTPKQLEGLPLPAKGPVSRAPKRKRVLPYPRPEPKDRLCLRCNKLWHSPDKKRCWICPACHTLIDHPNFGTGEWMNIDAIHERNDLHWNDFDPLPTIRHEIERLFFK